MTSSTGRPGMIPCKSDVLLDVSLVVISLPSDNPVKADNQLSLDLAGADFCVRLYLDSPLQSDRK